MLPNVERPEDAAEDERTIQFRWIESRRAGDNRLMSLRVPRKVIVALTLF